MRKSKKTVISIIVILLILLVSAFTYWYLKVQKPRNELKKGNQTILSKDKKLENAIDRLQKIVDSKETPLDETLLEKAKENIKKADEVKKAKTESAYEENIESLNKLSDNLEISIKQYKQFITPTEDFILQRLKKVDEIKEIKAVTENKDPNRQLNKQGGYTAAIYFESANVKQSELGEGDVIDKGTVAGGSIEVYKTKEEAEKRDIIFSTVDGTILGGNSHRVIGTIIIRTSKELTATKQKALEGKIIDAISKIE